MGVGIPVLLVTVVVALVVSQEPPWDSAYHGHKQKVLTANDNDSTLVLISTLDGKVTALDVDDSGLLRWQLDTGAGMLLSATIHSYPAQGIKNGQLIIPSLDGGLFQWDGDGMKALPFTVDSLLDSSARLSEDAILVGGKAVTTYAIAAYSGELRYTCSAAGCLPWQKEIDVIEEDLMLIQRVQKTVRAVMPRTGAEKWNFSVGQYDVMFCRGSPSGFDFIPGTARGAWPGSICSERGTEPKRELQDLGILLKLSVPDGKIMALTNNGEIDWQYKFDSPVAAAWLLKGGKIFSISLFDQSNVPALDPSQKRHWCNQEEGEEDLVEQARSVVEASVYLGMYEGQMYIQVSPAVTQRVSMAAQKWSSDPSGYSSGLIPIPRVKWKPFLATAVTLTPADIQFTELQRHIGNVQQQSEGNKQNALSIVRACGNDGFYFQHFYEQEQQRNKKGVRVRISVRDTGEVDFEMLDPQEGIIRFLQIDALVSLGLCILLGLCASLYFWKLPNIDVQRTRGSSESEAQTDEKCDGLLEKEKNMEAGVQDGTAVYVSRYLMDFEHLQCLGRGGFGVVFEAINKVDDCHYAIKRIRLPNRPYAREKVLREVKALAKLEHPGVVRYFNAWMESPSLSWQEEHDRHWIGDCSSLAVWSSGNPVVEKQPTSVRQTMQGQSSHSIILSDDKIPAVYSSPFPATESDPSLQQLGCPPCYTKQLSASNGDSMLMDKMGTRHSLKEDSLNFNILDSSVVNRSDSDSLEIVFEDSRPPDATEASATGETFTQQRHAGKGNVRNCSSTSPNCSSLLPAESDAVPSTEASECLFSSLSYSADQRTDVPSPSSKQPCHYLYIQMQLCQKENLKDWLNSRTQLADRPRSECLAIFRQIVGTVHFLHTSGLMHRDLKPSNIFFSLDGVVKIGDFGLVTAMDHEEDESDTSLSSAPAEASHTGRVGTTLYMSPEQLAGKVYSHKVDIYSMGLILFELMCPFSTQMERIQTLSDARKHIFPAHFVASNHDEYILVKELLCHDPALRPEAEQIAEASSLSSPQNSSFAIRQRPRTWSASGSKAHSPSLS
uniref:eukaryotic translation initiation factor 2-alpha kinase 3 isoform X2 n=1 Tax=Myxine glutinosa TaxID=7769 RepID=UPI00358EA748